MTQHTLPYVPASQGERSLFITVMNAELLTRISYVAVRGQSTEEGAVQRVLNGRRISSIKEFAVNIGDFPNCIVLNWQASTTPLGVTDNALTFEDTERSAQIIDGQHRVAGLSEAIRIDPRVGEIGVPVAIYQNLSTRECADIFLAINTEQKSVPKSLVIDLYGVSSEELLDPAAARARDVAMLLHDEEISPYYSNIKLPGAKVRKGGIALSTVAAALKPLVEEKGDFEQIGLSELETQGKVILNYFRALADCYGADWESSKNAFQYASGFTGAVDFFKARIIPYCTQRSSFEYETIRDTLTDLRRDPIRQDEVKGLGGKDAPRLIFDRLVSSFNAGDTTIAQFKI